MGQTWRCPLASHGGTEAVWELRSRGNGSTHQPPLSSSSVCHSCPMSPTLVWGYSPWMKGESWEGLLSCSLQWINSGADSVLLGAARSCKERWMSCWELAGVVSPGDWWVNTVPLSPWVKPTHRDHRTTVLSQGSFMFEEMRSRRSVHWADVGKLVVWERRLHHRVLSFSWRCFTAAQ